MGADHPRIAELLRAADPLNSRRGARPARRSPELEEQVLGGRHWRQAARNGHEAFGVVDSQFAQDIWSRVRCQVVGPRPRGGDAAHHRPRVVVVDGEGVGDGAQRGGRHAEVLATRVTDGSLHAAT